MSESEYEEQDDWSVTRDKEERLGKSEEGELVANLVSSLIASNGGHEWAIQLEIEEAEWKKEALCRGSHNDVFFPLRGESMLPAYRICSGCSVREECFEAARGNNFGVWAGFSTTERKKIQAVMRNTGKSFKQAMKPYDDARKKKLNRANLKARSMALVRR